MTDYTQAQPVADRASDAHPRYEPPAYRIVSLDCEITAYAPDDEPLF